MSAPQNARARARAELTREIIESGREQLATVGPQALSLRAIARDLGMASSAVYRYVRNRDELLTALLLDAYGAMGTHAETAYDTAHRAGSDHRSTWIAVWDSVRAWSLDHHHEFALLYGTPVPDYAAPPETVDAASRTPMVLARILTDAAQRGRLATIHTAPTAVASNIRQLVGPQIPAGNLAALLNAWTLMIGTVTFELFGQYNGVISDNDTYYRHTAMKAADDVGLP